MEFSRNVVPVKNVLLDALISKRLVDGIIQTSDGYSIEFHELVLRLSGCDDIELKKVIDVSNRPFKGKHIDRAVTYAYQTSIKIGDNLDDDISVLRAAEYLKLVSYIDDLRTAIIKTYPTSIDDISTYVKFCEEVCESSEEPYRLCAKFLDSNDCEEVKYDDLLEAKYAYRIARYITTSKSATTLADISEAGISDIVNICDKIGVKGFLELKNFDISPPRWFQRGMIPYNETINQINSDIYPNSCDVLYFIVTGHHGNDTVESFTSDKFFVPVQVVLPRAMEYSPVYAGTLKKLVRKNDSITVYLEKACKVYPTEGETEARLE